MKAKKIFSGCIIGMTLATNSFADIANKSAQIDASPRRLYLAQKPVQQPSLASPVTSNYAEIVNSIDDLIIARVVENWARPPSARNGMVVVVQVEMVQDGTMRSVNVAKSSGDVPYDNSVVAAVKSIGRLSEMQKLKPSDFQPYRSFKLTFSPGDLAL